MGCRTVSWGLGHALVVVVASACLTMAGCGPAATSLSGVVTLDGEPVPDAMLEFFPVSGIGPVTIGRCDSQGRYTAVVAPTKVSVMLSATKIVGKVVDPSTPGGGEMDEVRNVLPERYGSHKTSGVTADPVAGKTVTADFHLKSTADTL